VKIQLLHPISDPEKKSEVSGAEKSSIPATAAEAAGAKDKTPRMGTREGRKRTPIQRECAPETVSCKSRGTSASDFLLTLPALWLVLTLVFLMIHIVPGDPVEQMLGEGAAPGELAQLRHALDLDKPLLEQYGHYLKRLAHGDLGKSLKYQAPGAESYFLTGIQRRYSWRF